MVDARPALCSGIVTAEDLTQGFKTAL